MSGHVELVTHTSTILQGNPLGDPHVRRFPVYVPEGYDPDGDRRYPVLYVLQGYAGTGLQVENFSPWGETLSQRLDRLIADGCPPAIVVAPDCFTHLGGSQYLNSTATGRYEDYLVDEIVPFIDRGYRTIATNEGRGVLGKSSGGFGALRLGMAHPDVFGGVASHAGDMGFIYGYLPDFPKVVNALRRDPDIPKFIEAFLAKQKKPGRHFGVMNILAMAACYTPDPDSLLGFRLPFDVHTGAIVEDVWAKWLANDPVHLVDSHTDALKGLRLLYVDCGYRDNFNLHLGARQLVEALKRHGIAHFHEEFDDDHFGLTYRFDVSIPMLLNALEH